jgi:hypothetical protein
MSDDEFYRIKRLPPFANRRIHIRGELVHGRRPVPSNLGQSARGACGQTRRLRRAERLPLARRGSGAGMAECGQPCGRWRYSSEIVILTSRTRQRSIRWTGRWVVPSITMDRCGTLYRATPQYHTVHCPNVRAQRAEKSAQSSAHMACSLSARSGCVGPQPDARWVRPSTMAWACGASSAS